MERGVVAHQHTPHPVGIGGSLSGRDVQQVSATRATSGPPSCPNRAMITEKSILAAVLTRAPACPRGRGGTSRRIGRWYRPTTSRARSSAARARRPRTSSPHWASVQTAQSPFSLRPFCRDGRARPPAPRRRGEEPGLEAAAVGTRAAMEQEQRRILAHAVAVEDEPVPTTSTHRRTPLTAANTTPPRAGSGGGCGSPGAAQATACCCWTLSSMLAIWRT